MFSDSQSRPQPSERQNISYAEDSSLFELAFSDASQKSAWPLELSQTA